jgi:predicted transcriptional regulator
MGLCYLNRKYDYSMDLISESKEAIEWGENFFQHYRTSAKKINPKELGSKQ